MDARGRLSRPSRSHVLGLAATPMPVTGRLRHSHQSQRTPPKADLGPPRPPLAHTATAWTASVRASAMHTGRLPLDPVFSPDSAMNRHALWLLPSSAHEPLLAEHIARLSSWMQSTRFEPHVTILSGIDTEPQSLAQLTAALASQSPVMPCTVARVAPGAQYFECIYLDLQANTTFDVLQSAARALFGISDVDATAHPHLSLAYGEPHPDNAKLCAVLAEQFTGADHRLRSHRAGAIVQESRCRGLDHTGRVSLACDRNQRAARDDHPAYSRRSQP